MVTDSSPVLKPCHGKMITSMIACLHPIVHRRLATSPPLLNPSLIHLPRTAKSKPTSLGRILESLCSSQPPTKTFFPSWEETRGKYPAQTGDNTPGVGVFPIQVIYLQYPVGMWCPKEQSRFGFKTGWAYETFWSEIGCDYLFSELRETFT